jgi:SpoVK/Ycf46/Vps4 family AAA+-type ATPase
MSLMNEKTTLFLESMDKKYEEQTRNWTEQSNQDLIHRLKEMDKKYQKYYSSIHYSGRDFTDVFHYTYESLNPNDYYDETYELKKREQKLQKEQKVQKEQNAEKTKKEKKVKTVPVFHPFKNPKTKVNIEVEITNIHDLIELTEKYELSPAIEYNIDMETLHKIKPGLQQLNSMIGMKDLKENIVDQILYYLQDLHKQSKGDFLHTVIYGSPGTGKTEIAKMVGKIFGDLGILKKGTFRKVVRSDLIAGYLGQTAIKTKEVITESLGGVLFIDEAYSLGNPEKRDSFSKECIDTLCEALSDHKDDLMVIIAGYEEELKECFFDYNQGLDSRFTWRFKTDKYDEKELHQIFLKKITDCEWSCDEEVNSGVAWFKKNLDYFKYYGRDMETLLSKVKIAHSRRIFGKKEGDFEKKKVTMKDLEKGFQMYLKNEEVKNRKERGDMEKRLLSIYV